MGKIGFLNAAPRPFSSREIIVTESPGLVHVPEYRKEVSEDLKIPIYADATTIKAAVKNQMVTLETLKDDLDPKTLEIVEDAIFYLGEAVEALEKVSGQI